MKPVSAIMSLLFMTLMAVALSSISGIGTAYIFGGLVALSFIPMPKGVALMAIQKEIWQKDIVKNLFKDNEFAKYAVNGDSYVLGGAVVHIPFAGAPAVIKKNLTSFPQTAVNRIDTEATYALDIYYALPRQIQKLEEYQLSYDKRMSVVGEDISQLVQSAMEGLLYRWAPVTANILETTGADSGLDLIDSTATGTRKLFTKATFGTIVKKMRKANLGNTNIMALLTTEHFAQFFESLSEGEKTSFNNVANLKEGTIGRYMGVNVIQRSTVARYRKVSSVWTVVDEQDAAFAPGTGDSAASLFWSDVAVERAKGDINVFEDNGNPLYYGDVFSANMFLGGRKRRNEGVYAVVEAIGA